MYPGVEHDSTIVRRYLIVIQTIELDGPPSALGMNNLCSLPRHKPSPRRAPMEMPYAMPRLRCTPTEIGEMVITEVELELVCDSDQVDQAVVLSERAAALADRTEGGCTIQVTLSR